MRIFLALSLALLFVSCNNFRNSSSIEVVGQMRDVMWKGFGDRPPKYIGNEDSINAFFNQNVHDSFFSRFVDEKGYESMYVHMWVDSTGKLISLRSYSHYNLPIQQEMNRLVDIFPYRARPATDDGKPSSGRASIQLTFWLNND